MPDWHDDAIVLAVRPHGERNVLLSLLTERHGRHAGLVRSGSSNRLKGVLLPGNKVRASWRARLPEQLGSMNVELTDPVPAFMLDSPLRLAGLSSFCAILDGALPEREDQKGLFTASSALLDLIKIDGENHAWLEGYVKWEIGLLAALGYRLNLSRCVVSGKTEDFAYVSPKSGGVVAQDAAGNYASRLLILPSFLGGTFCKKNDWVAGLNLTGHFLSRQVFGERNIDIPTPRKRLADMVAKRYNS